MTKVLCFLLYIIISFASFGQGVADKLGQYFDAAQKANVFNGSVLVVQQGDTLLNKGYGFKDVDAKTPTNKNTIYQIGSVTKQFTSTVILKLAEQGKLGLNDKLTKYFPDYPNGNKITIEHLLTHTSGIYNYTTDRAFMESGSDKPSDQQKMMDLFKNKPLDFEPGTKYNYSNSGYQLLGYIIEKVTGRKYESVVRELIFTPLHMTHSGFDFTHLSSTNKAVGYNSLNDSIGNRAKIVDSSVSFSAGAIYSTTGDLVKWDDAVASAKILSSQSLKNAFTSRLSNYGFGYVIDTLNGDRRISHNGGIDGFLSHNSIITNKDIKIVILTNSRSTKMNDVINSVFAILYEKPVAMPEAKATISLDSTVLKKYIGDYELAPNFKLTITLNGNQLSAQATGQSAADIFPQKENYFFYKVVDAQIEFVLNDQGEVDKLVLHQNGQNMPAKKVR